jgi:hypothetical protein
MSLGALGNLDTVEFARHMNVGHKHLETVHVELTECLIGIVGADHFLSRVGKNLAHHFADNVLILHDQNSCVHREISLAGVKEPRAEGSLPLSPNWHEQMHLSSPAPACLSIAFRLCVAIRATRPASSPRCWCAKARAASSLPRTRRRPGTLPGAGATAAP